MKSKYILITAVILLVPAFFYVYSLEDEEDQTRLSYEEVLGREITIGTNENLENQFFILDIEPTDEQFEQEMTIAASLTPLFVQSRPGMERYNPVVVGSGEKGVGTLSELTERNVITISPEQLNSELYLDFYEKSTGCFLVRNYSQAIVVAPAASLVGIPIFLENDPTARSTMKALEVDFVIAIDDTPIPDNVEYARMSSVEVVGFYLDLLESSGLECDYIVITNPDDITDYQARLTDGNLPVAGLSLLSAELAAYRKAPILFSPGLPDFDKEYGDGFTQLGISRELNNQYADKILGKVHQGTTLLQEHGMTPDYLALVGGPITLPMFSWDINDYQQSRQYTPCDYYFGNLNEDPYQELAVGRIFAGSLTDASLMVVRTLAFEEIKDYPYPADTSSSIYDTVSEDWKENSLACVGTTKIGPFPGILTPTLANQTKTMTQAGFHVTSMGYDIATQAEIVKEIIDEMNYAVYYGHGDYDCWYSSAPDPIDSDMINGEDLKPGFAIAMACLTGMTDSVTTPLDQMIALAFIHSGYAGYIGATRVAYGLYDYEIREDGAICGTGALYLVDVFSDMVCSEDANVGDAMRVAKNDLIFKDGWDNEEVRITVTQYVLYGDPAHNLWIPGHDG